jgi:SnoaL-like polyketide cyclase
MILVTGATGNVGAEVVRAVRASACARSCAIRSAEARRRDRTGRLVAEGDRVTIRWALRGTSSGSMLGRPPSGQPGELAAIVIFRIADGKIAERWAGWKPGYAPGR